MTPPASLLKRTRWIGPALVLAGVIGAAGAFLDTRPEKNAFELGVLYTLTRYDQALPLLGLAIVIAQLPGSLCLAGLASLALGIVVGGFISGPILAALLSQAGLFGYVLLIGPAGCVLVGIALAAPRVIAVWLALPVAFLVGAALGLVINFNDPTAAGSAFAAGAVLAGLWLVIPPLLVWRGFSKPWFSIPGRIFGSWLIAIGAMLGAAQLIPRPPRPAPPPTVEAPANPEAPLIDEPPVGMPLSEPPQNPTGIPDNVQ